ncbi:MAG: shikimate dehydrogenase [Bacteroidetes bacterium]|nr:shikimate dehydrogenase [Bacteroidota bacterium]
MKLFGLIGYPLSHSWSAQYFRQKFEELQLEDHEYRLFPLEKIENFPGLLSDHPGILGLNVTIPHKVTIIDYLDGLSKEAREIGAVNCIRLRESAGSIETMGFNTDCYGFRRSLEPLLEKYHRNALILGTGGASKAVAHVLNELGIQFRFVSRNPESPLILKYEELRKEILEQNTLIINTTPLGMFPDIKSYPDIPYQFLNKKHLLYDLVYNPSETQFLRKGRQAGAMIKKGIEMLQLQAEESWRIWNSFQ